MAQPVNLKEINSLTRGERIALVQAIWDSIDAEPHPSIVDRGATARIAMPCRGPRNEPKRRCAMATSWSASDRSVEAMSVAVFLRNAARSEFDQAADWYEQRRTDLGYGLAER
jgi:hypothetical protein